MARRSAERSFLGRSATRTLGAGTALFALVFSHAPAAHAEDCAPDSRLTSCVDADNLWFKAGAGQFLSVGSGQLTAPKQISFGLMTSYQRRPLVLRLPSTDPGGTDTAAIGDQVNATFLWAFGVSRGVELTAAVPATLYQNGVGTRPLSDQHPTDIPRSATRDPRLGATFAIVPRAPTTTEGLAVAGRAEVILPVGDETLYAGQSGFGVVPSVALEYRSGPLVVGADVGGRIRKTVDLSGTRIGPQLNEAVGVSYDVLPREQLTVAVEAFSLQTLAKQTSVVRDASGALVDGPSRSMHAPTEWMASLRSAPALAGDVSFHLGGGGAIPLTDNAATAPAFRIVGGVRYAPLGRDQDGDGILDRDDKCPTEPEDKDGFEDEDGCPDPDNDRDGIPDAEDKCRDAAEDFDGFQDDDGCPDPDDDEDGVLDADDRCRNEPEDKDGFQDEDGCPDPDNDQDGIPDAKDMCPNGPEDFDGFKDEDGCPDPDNDMDRILDKDDKCPNEPEDYDGFEDDDGCPDPDNDQDGIPDVKDKCPNEPETINGIDDEDGCPEPNAKDAVTLTKGRIDVVPPLRFKAGDAKVDGDLAKGLRMAAQKARGVKNLDRIIVEVYGDAGGAPAKQEQLALQRADAVKAALASSIPSDVLTVAAGDPGTKRAPNAAHVDVQVIVRKAPKAPPAPATPAPATPAPAPATPPKN